MPSLPVTGPCLMITELSAGRLVMVEAAVLGPVRTRRASPLVFDTRPKPVSLGAAGLDAFVFAAEEPACAAWPTRKSESTQPTPPGPSTLYQVLPLLSLAGPARMVTVWPSW